VYWKPVFNLLEGQLEIMVVNAYHLKAVPGRKTDVRDSEWIADLLQHGLLKPSFIPPAPQRELRELTRYRTSLVEERARIVNRLQKVLEDTNFKLSSVVTDITGVSARAMLARLLEGETDPAVLAERARGRLREKRLQLEQALAGCLKPHHRFLLSEQLGHIDYLDEAIERLNTEIEQRLKDQLQEIDRLDTIPGVNRRVAEVLLAEIGSDMSRFASEKHLASWAGMCPGNNESAGKRYSGRTRKGNQSLRRVLIEAAHGASHTKNTYLGAQFRRIAARRGKKRAAVAVGHTILVIAYFILSGKKDYTELGHDYFEKRNQDKVERKLVERLERLGYKVTLQPKALAS
jgi:transposase